MNNPLNDQEIEFEGVIHALCKIGQHTCDSDCDNCTLMYEDLTANYLKKLIKSIDR